MSIFGLEDKDGINIKKLGAVAKVIHQKLQLTNRDMVRVPFDDIPSQKEVLFYMQENHVVQGYEEADFPDNKRGEFYVRVIRERFTVFYDELIKIAKQIELAEKTNRDAYSMDNEGLTSLEKKQPFCLVDKGQGYLKLGKFGKKIKIGSPEARPFGLLNSVLQPFGTAKTIETTFEAIRIKKDVQDSDLSGYDGYKKRNKQLAIIRNTIKELQKGKKLGPIGIKIIGDSKIYAKID